MSEGHRHHIHDSISWWKIQFFFPMLPLHLCTSASRHCSFPVINDMPSVIPQSSFRYRSECSVVFHGGTALHMKKNPFFLSWPFLFLLSFPESRNGYTTSPLCGQFNTDVWGYIASNVSSAGLESLFVLFDSLCYLILLFIYQSDWLC